MPAAPLFSSARDDCCSVPAVSTMSSRMHADAIPDLADDVHHLGVPVLGAALVDDRQVRVQPLGVGARPLHAAGVGRDDRHVAPVAGPRQVVDEDRRREQMVDRDVEEPLDLRLVQVHRQHAVGAGRAHQIGDQLRRDRHPRLVLAVLAGIAVVRHHRGDAGRRRPPERVDHHAQLDQVLVHRRAGRLHDEHVGATDVLVDLKRHLGVPRSAATPPGPSALQGRRRSLPPAPHGRCPRTASDLRCESARVLARKRSPNATPGRAAASALVASRAGGWGGRIRTFEYGIQSPAPYRLATPHR